MLCRVNLAQKFAGNGLSLKEVFISNSAEKSLNREADILLAGQDFPHL